MQNKLTRRSFCSTALFAAAASRTFGLSSHAQHFTERPNVVYILADDMGWGDMEVYNPHSAVPTPHCNRFAGQGRRFTDMHSSSAVCTPSRYSILTGRYCWRSSLKKRTLNGDSPCLIEDGRLTVPQMLKNLGYYTAGVGKWHLGLGSAAKTDFTAPLRPGPISIGFDYYFGIPASLDIPPYLYFENEHVVEDATVDDRGSSTPRGVFWRAGKRAKNFDIPQVLPHLTNVACRVLEERSKSGQPFFLYFAMPSPHTPWVPLEEYRGKSRAGLYGDYVCEVDAMIGTVLDKLKALGMDQNTIVIVTSDNGADWKPGDIEQYPHRANDRWKGEKGDIWEAGHRIPFIARWPGHIPANSVCAEIGSLTDLMGTLADLLHFSLPRDAGEDSYSLLPAWLNKPHAPIRNAIVDHSSEGMFCIQEGDWKLELGLGSGGFTKPDVVEPAVGGVQGQLFNLRLDPEEMYNVWDQHPDIVARLTKQLDDYKSSGRSRP